MLFKILVVLLLDVCVVVESLVFYVFLFVLDLVMSVYLIVMWEVIEVCCKLKLGYLDLGGVKSE